MPQFYHICSAVLEDVTQKPHQKTHHGQVFAPVSIALNGKRWFFFHRNKSAPPQCEHIHWILKK